MGYQQHATPMVNCALQYGLFWYHLPHFAKNPPCFFTTTSCGMQTCSHLYKDKWDSRLCVPQTGLNKHAPNQGVRFQGFRTSTLLSFALYLARVSIKNGVLCSLKWFNHLRKPLFASMYVGNLPSPVNPRRMTGQATLTQNCWPHAGSSVLQWNEDCQRRRASTTFDLDRFGKKSFKACFPFDKFLNFLVQICSNQAYSQSVGMQRLLLSTWWTFGIQ